MTVLGRPKDVHRPTGLRSHQWCFLLFNILLFHALLFGADLVEEYLLQPTPGVYTDAQVLDVRERARKLDLNPARDNNNISRAYVIANPRACLDPDLFLLALVFSAPANASARDAVRRTWANRTRVRGFPVRALFFVGPARTPPAAVQEALAREAERHGDVVQGRVTTTTADSSSSSSPSGPKERVVLALRWVVAFCPAARFVLLTRDSVFVNLPALGGYLLGLRRHPEDLYLGRVIQRDRPGRDPARPGYLPARLYPDRYLPDYCAGAAYVLSQDVVRKAYVASEAIGAPLPADVFVGLCARKAGVAPAHSARFSGDKHIRYNDCCYRYMFSSAGMDAEGLAAAWADVGQADGACSLIQTYYGLVACKALTYLDKLSFFSAQGRADPVATPFRCQGSPAHVQISHLNVWR
ncbi:putative UDP-GlcNAc:betaGal beta-1,3-N-acetylglucosaminyltransferase [Merluccius polli]|uniref:Hexosyltransferase n=1 Tax=Merluccius polli TaxID=89951 RepID=A0AA47P7X9_MERPO|nr:putative UDP-GlcNAc:betaGal beta-1,3-N-acetylglucosaminyltransferase [Merluccius polli]